MDIKITASIVSYNNDIAILGRAIDCFLNTPLNVQLYLIDNSPNDSIKKLAVDSRLEYIHNPSNPGFGAAHNIGIEKAMNLGSKYHFIINPDVYFDEHVVGSMVAYMAGDLSIGMLMPKVLNQDGTIQYLPKLLPSPLSIIRRKIKWPPIAHKRFINKYELREVSNEIIYNAPVLSGCFTLLSLDAVKKVGMYDDTFFMYFEDWDLSRRMHKSYKTIYFPNVSVVHEYESGANKSKKLFKIFLHSAKTYFNKWGWLFDREREDINNKALSQFK